MIKISQKSRKQKILILSKQFQQDGKSTIVLIWWKYLCVKDIIQCYFELVIQRSTVVGTRLYYLNTKKRRQIVTVNVFKQNKFEQRQTLMKNIIHLCIFPSREFLIRSVLHTLCEKRSESETPDLGRCHLCTAMQQNFDTFV